MSIHKALIKLSEVLSQHALGSLLKLELTWGNHFFNCSEVWVSNLEGIVPGRYRQQQFLPTEWNLEVYQSKLMSSKSCAVRSDSQLPFSVPLTEM